MSAFFVLKTASKAYLQVIGDLLGIYF